MQIQASNDFAADPVTVHAMLTDPAFLSAVCEASGDVDHRVDSSESLSALERTMTAPSTVKSLLGETLTMRQEVRWNPPAPDGSRTGTLNMNVKGLPATATTSVQLRPGGKGTVVDFTGDFSIKVPIIGRKLEGQAAPVLLQGFAVQQQVGDDWLARTRA